MTNVFLGLNTVHHFFFYFEKVYFNEHFLSTNRQQNSCLVINLRTQSFPKQTFLKAFGGNPQRGSHSETGGFPGRGSARVTLGRHRALEKGKEDGHARRSLSFWDKTCACLACLEMAFPTTDT